MECYFADLMVDHGPADMIYLGTKDGGAVFHCLVCGLVSSPKVNRHAYLSLYSDPGRYFKESVSVGYSSFPDRFNHDRQIAEIRVKNMRRVFHGRSSGRVLDVGCGNCALTVALTEAGFDASGVDLDSWSHRQAVAFGLIGDVVSECCDYIDYEPECQFDVIMFTDSFEHFLFPQSYADKALKMLKPGGLIVLEMPDTDSDGWRSKGIAWHHVKPQEHPFLYCEVHIQHLFLMGGGSVEIVRVIHTIPGRVVYYLQKAD